MNDFCVCAQGCLSTFNTTTLATRAADLQVKLTKKCLQLTKCSELFAHTIPVNPAFLHMLSPPRYSCDQPFHLEMKLDPVLLFHALQENLSSLGYILNSGSMVRTGKLLKTNSTLL